jgi:hypothetical protein
VKWKKWGHLLPRHAPGIQHEPPFFAPAACRWAQTTDRAIDIMEDPIHIACGIGQLCKVSKDLSLPPAAETAGRRAPQLIALGQIAPRLPGAKNPQNLNEITSVVNSGSVDLRILGWQEWSQPLSLYVGQIFPWSTELQPRPSKSRSSLSSWDREWLIDPTQPVAPPACNARLSLYWCCCCNKRWS